jgi:hypothetical protein
MAILLDPSCSFKAVIAEYIILQNKKKEIKIRQKRKKKKKRKKESLFNFSLVCFMPLIPQHMKAGLQRGQGWEEELNGGWFQWWRGWRWWVVEGRTVGVVDGSIMKEVVGPWMRF